MTWRHTDVDAGVERQQERALCRHEAAQDRLEAEAEMIERQYEAACDDPRGLGDGLGLA